MGERIEHVDPEILLGNLGYRIDTRRQVPPDAGNGVQHTAQVLDEGTNHREYDRQEEH
ncbi:hypothetical protein D3C72_2032900 [compost metagenome]